jgi:hypothetical protein
MFDPAAKELVWKGKAMAKLLKDFPPKSKK